MKCPACTETILLMTERQGIEIDYCPQCRGVWLCRGELDKIIERSLRDSADTPSHQTPASPSQQTRPQRGCDDETFGRSGNQSRRGGFFKDLFD